MADSLEPVFPPELEEFIFCLAIQDDLKLAGKLCLVAKRVHGWMLPRIYEVVIFSYEQETCVPHPTYSVESLSDHGKYVRHLLLHNLVGQPARDKENCHTCLVRCQNLRSLGLWSLEGSAYTPEIIDLLGSLQLEYLSFDLQSFTDASATQGRTTPISFPTITHLEIIGLVKDMRLVKKYFPNLTHLAISSLSDSRIDVLTDSLAVFGSQLKVVLWYLWKDGYNETPPVVVPTSGYIAVDDPRVVVLWYGGDFITSWHKGVKGGLGIWRAAEEAIRARRVAGGVLL